MATTTKEAELKFVLDYHYTGFQHCNLKEFNGEKVTEGMCDILYLKFCEQSEFPMNYGGMNLGNGKAIYPWGGVITIDQNNNENLSFRGTFQECMENTQNNRRVVPFDGLFVGQYNANTKSKRVTHYLPWVNLVYYGLTIRADTSYNPNFVIKGNCWGSGALPKYILGGLMDKYAVIESLPEGSYSNSYFLREVVEGKEHNSYKSIF